MAKEVEVKEIADNEETFTIGDDELGALESNILASIVGKEDAEEILSGLDEEELPEDIQELLDNVPPFDEAK
ncbi:MAG: hypothetical protein J6Y78_15400 [Paludibacteraceae bacterium]|nr:hypothetical protein [Paludibacteraceae bacterium]